MIKIITLIFFMCCMVLQADQSTYLDSTIELAKELDASSEFQQSAVEFRRASLISTKPEETAIFSIFAANEYIKANLFKESLTELDKAGENSTKLDDELGLLYFKANDQQKKYNDAKFYLEPLQFYGDEISQYSILNIAAINVREKNLANAITLLENANFDTTKELMAIERYSKGKDKTPWIGGILGIIPGLGYAYTGEYSNALRSLILNGIFIFGMVETAEDDLWGAFAVITFFVATWYTGSIYGGIDSSHRYNRNRLEECIEDISGNTKFNLETKDIPAITLNFQF
jgi:hypothetical protein